MSLLEKLERRAAADPLLSPKEVCEILSVSLRTLTRMRKAGTGPAWRRVGGSIRYPSSVVFAFIEDVQAAES